MWNMHDMDINRKKSSYLTQWHQNFGNSSSTSTLKFKITIYKFRSVATFRKNDSFFCFQNIKFFFWFFVWTNPISTHFVPHIIEPVRIPWEKMSHPETVLTLTRLQDGTRNTSYGWNTAPCIFETYLEALQFGNITLVWKQMFMILERYIGYWK